MCVYVGKMPWASRKEPCWRKDRPETNQSADKIDRLAGRLSKRRTGFARLQVRNASAIGWGQPGRKTPDPPWVGVTGKACRRAGLGGGRGECSLSFIKVAFHA